MGTVVYGTRLYGKTDQVPGFFHVATKFAHVQYLPLIPYGSYVVVSTNGDSFRGVPIPLSGKSVMLAWARAFTLLTTVLLPLFAWIDYDSNRRTGGGDAWPVLMAVWAAGAVVCGLSWLHPSARRASFNRACEIGHRIGLSERGFAELERIYGQTSGRGFAVVEPSGAGPAAALSPVLPLDAAPSPYGQPAYVGAGPAGGADSALPLADPPAAGAGTLFWVRGVYRTTGTAACVPVTAADGSHARAIGFASGIEVQTVQYEDGSLA